MNDTTEPAGQEAVLGRKISSKTVYGGVNKIRAKMAEEKNLDPEKPKVTKLYNVWGVASSTKRGVTDMGPFVALIGRFEALHLDTGEILTAPQCFLPEPTCSMLASQLEATTELLDPKGNVMFDSKGEPRTRRLTNSVEFGFEVGVKPMDSTVGFEYVTSVVVKPGGADPLSDLRSKIPAFKALSAPEKEDDAESGGKNAGGAAKSGAKK